MDEAAFRTFFAAQFNDVWRFARRRCSSADQADDVAAETFAVAWRRRNDLPPGGEARLWLFGTARLVLANQRRGDRRRAGLQDRLAAVPAPRSPDDPADVVVADADTDGKLWAALAGLSDDDRDLLMMRAWDEIAVSDIAVLLGCTPNAASLRLHRARARLADALAAGSGGSPPAVGEVNRSTPSTGRTASATGHVAPVPADLGPDLTTAPDRHVDIAGTDPAGSRTSNVRAPNPEGGNR